MKEMHEVYEALNRMYRKADYSNSVKYSADEDMETLKVVVDKFFAIKEIVK